MAGIGTGNADVHRQWSTVWWVVWELARWRVLTTRCAPPHHHGHRHQNSHTKIPVISSQLSFPSPKHSSKKPTQKRLLPRNLAFLAAFSTFQAPTHNRWCGVQNDEHDRPNAHGLLQSGLITPKCCVYYDKCNIVEQPCKFIVHATHNADEQISMKLKKSQFHKAGSKNNIRDKLLGRLLGNSPLVPP